LNAIAEAHKSDCHRIAPHAALVANIMKGIRCTRGMAAVQKAPTLTDDIRAMIDAWERV
jgi:hypothetical protein